MKSKLQGQLEIARKIDEKKERRRNKVKWLCVLRKSRRMQADSDPMKTKDEEDGSVEFSGKPVERKLFPKRRHAEALARALFPFERTN